MRIEYQADYSQADDQWWVARYTYDSGAEGAAPFDRHMAAGPYTHEEQAKEAAALLRAGKPLPKEDTRDLVEPAPAVIDLVASSTIAELRIGDEVALRGTPLRGYVVSMQRRTLTHDHDVLVQWPTGWPVRFRAGAFSGAGRGRWVVGHDGIAS